MGVNWLLCKVIFSIVTHFTLSDFLVEDNPIGWMERDNYYSGQQLFKMIVLQAIYYSVIFKIKVGIFEISPLSIEDQKDQIKIN